MVSTWQRCVLHFGLLHGGKHLHQHPSLLPRNANTLARKSGFVNFFLKYSSNRSQASSRVIPRRMWSNGLPKIEERSQATSGLWHRMLTMTVDVTCPGILADWCETDTGLERVVCNLTQFGLEGVATPRIRRERETSIRACPTTVGTIEKAETLLILLACHSFTFCLSSLTTVCFVVLLCSWTSMFRPKSCLGRHSHLPQKSILLSSHKNDT